MISSDAGDVQHERRRRRIRRRRPTPIRSEPACQTVSPTRPATTTSDDEQSAATSNRRGAVSARSSSDGLTCRISSSGTSENSTETSRPMPKPCSTAGTVRRVVDDDAGRRRGGQRRRNRANRQPGEHDAERAAGQARARSPAPCRWSSSCQDRPPRHLRIAMLRIFCCTNTRVTLDTPMPPRMTMTRPTRLR